MQIYYSIQNYKSLLKTILKIIFNLRLILFDNFVKKVFISALKKYMSNNFKFNANKNIIE